MYGIRSVSTQHVDKNVSKGSSIKALRIMATLFDHNANHVDTMDEINHTHIYYKCVNFKSTNTGKFSLRASLHLHFAKRAQALISLTIFISVVADSIFVPVV